MTYTVHGDSCVSPPLHFLFFPFPMGPQPEPLWRLTSMVSPLALPPASKGTSLESILRGAGFDFPCFEDFITCKAIATFNSLVSTGSFLKVFFFLLLFSAGPHLSIPIAGQVMLMPFLLLSCSCTLRTNSTRSFLKYTL